ncbi:chitinase, partial [Escherichia coli]
PVKYYSPPPVYKSPPPPVKYYSPPPVYKSPPPPARDYCDENNRQYPCAPGKGYFGRGPIQLSWNYNYGACGQSLSLDLLRQPELVGSNPKVAF